MGKLSNCFNILSVVKPWNILFGLIVTFTDGREAGEWKREGGLGWTCGLDLMEFNCSESPMSCSVECRRGLALQRLCIPDELMRTRNLSLRLNHCKVHGRVTWIPERLFTSGNQLRILSIYAPVDTSRYMVVNSQFDHITTIVAGTFDNLESLEELTLEGFDWIKSIGYSAFVPLRGLKRLILVRFGAQFLSYRDLGTALQGLSNSLLTHITMDRIHTISNEEKVLDLTQLFRISGVNITSLVFVYNDFNAVSGVLSKVLPDLRYIRFNMYWLTFAATKFGLDSLVFLKNIEVIDYSFIRNPLTSSSYIPPDTTCFLCVLGPELLQYFFHNLTDSGGCYFKKLIKFSESLKRLTVQNMDFFYPDENPDLCQDPHNQLEHLDVYRSPIGTIWGRFKGFTYLRYLNMQDTHLTLYSIRVFHEMPFLEILLLGDNKNLGQIVSGDMGAELFRKQNRTLRSLDLSGCDVVYLPRHLFAGLNSLQHLNLSRNRLNRFEVDFTTRKPRLTDLNLSGNSLTTLSRKMINQLESIHNTTGGRLVVDLSGNPLSCLCNNTRFVSWLKVTDIVSLAPPGEYRCHHPNGSYVIVDHLNQTELESDCEVVDELRNATTPVCPCSGLDFRRLRQVALSLAEVKCSYGDKRFSYTELVSSSNRTIRDYWWCETVVTIDNPFHRSPKFLVPLILGCVVLLGLGVSVVIIYRKRYTPSEIASMIQCMDMRPYIAYVMRALRSRPEGGPGDVWQYDALVYFDDGDAAWTRQVVLERMGHLKVISPHDFLIGAPMLEAILEAVEKCRVIVFVLSEAFKDDGWCRETLLRAYTTRPSAVVPVLRRGFDLGCFEEDPLLSSLIVTNNPVCLGRDDGAAAAAAGGDGGEDFGEMVWKDLMQRIENTR